jgi:thioredoxin 1
MTKKLLPILFLSFSLMACSQTKKTTDTVEKKIETNATEPAILLENLNMEQFDKIVKSHKIVVVDFTAVWCGPCKRLAPILQNLEEEYGDKIKVVKIDIDKNRNLTNDFAIMSIPFVKMYKNGQLAEQWEGLPSKANLKYWIDKLLKG